MKDVRMEAAIDIKEVKVIGEWAWMRSFLKLTFKPVAGDSTKLSGHILTILRKTADGKWVIYRDANFVMPESAK
jgi:ketosteroid isomerase-like protein